MTVIMYNLISVLVTNYYEFSCFNSWAMKVTFDSNRD